MESVPPAEGILLQGFRNRQRRIFQCEKAFRLRGHVLDFLVESKKFFVNRRTPLMDVPRFREEHLPARADAEKERGFPSLRNGVGWWIFSL